MGICKPIGLLATKQERLFFPAKLIIRGGKKMKEMLFRKIENIRIKTEEKIRGVGYANANRNIILNKGEVMYNNRKNK